MRISHFFCGLAI